ncbi:MAG: hypothetical protein IH958_05970, partial [Chloroflexi bacterium]|nr:hypothetical protein [Chloroflexota bacterium]
MVLIDDELFIYDGTSNNKTPPDSLDNISSRGALGSTAAAHADNAHVFQIVPTSFATLFTDGIDSSQDTVLRLTGSLTGYGLNGGIVQISNEIITYTQTGTTSAECDGPAPCLLGLTRGDFGTLAKGHAEGVFVFTAAGDDIDQATANFTPANNYNDQALFDGVLSPNIIGGGMDVNGDGVIDSKDNSNQLLGASILSGLLDCDDFGTAPGNVGDGTIDASDDCTLTAEDGTTVITVVDGEFQLPDGPLALTFSDPDIDWNVINGRVDSDGSGDIGSDDCTLSIVDESLPFNNNGTTKGTNREIDILSSDGENLFMRSQLFYQSGLRGDLGPISGNTTEQTSEQAGTGIHLFAPMGFLDDTWFHRSYWVYGRNFAGGHNGYYQAGRFAPSGRILVFDDEMVYGYGRKPQYLRWTTTLEHQLFATVKEAPVVSQ